MTGKLRNIIMLAALFLSTLPAQAETWSTNLPCFRGGSYDGWDCFIMANAEGLGGARVFLSSGMNQVFAWTAIPMLATVTIAADDPQGAITNSGTIRVSVPTAWQCRFDMGAGVTYGGNAAGKVTPAIYSGDGRTLLIPVSQNFVAGDTLTLSGLKMADLRLVPAGTERLELDFDSNGTRDGYDQYAIQVSVQQPGGAYDGWDMAMSGYCRLLASGTFFYAK